MTARDRIRAEACNGCREGIPAYGIGSAQFMHDTYAANGDHSRDFHCAAPTDARIIEQQAGEIERLKGRITQMAKLYSMTLDNEIRWMRKHGELTAALSRIATAHGLPDGAGVEEIVERAKLQFELYLAANAIKATMEILDQLPDEPELKRLRSAATALDAARRQG